MGMLLGKLGNQYRERYQFHEDECGVHCEGDWTWSLALGRRALDRWPFCS